MGADDPVSIAENSSLPFSIDSYWEKPLPPTHLQTHSIEPESGRSNRRQFLQMAGAAVSGLTLSSCGWTLAEVRQTAPVSSTSDRLYIYTWSNYTDETLLKNFTKETGIEVIASVFDSNESMLAKLRAGGGAEFSIIYPTDYMVRQMSELGMLTELDHDRLYSLDNLFPRFRDPSYDPQNKHSIPTGWGTTGLIYNADRLQQAPDDWDYLWKNQRQLAKRITLLNDVREVMGAVLRMLGHSYNSTNPQHLQQAYEKLVELKPAIATFTSDAWRDQIVAGDLLMAMGYSADAIEVSKENPNLKYVIPRSGTSLWTDTMAIPKTAPNLDGAYAWIQYMLQPGVAADVCRRLNFATPNEAAAKLLPPEVRNNSSLFPPEALLEKSERIAPVGRFSEIYDRYWTQLTST